VDRAARVRWTVLLGILALTIAAIVYPVDRAGNGDSIVSVERAATRASNASHAVERDYAEPSDAGQDVEDPFAPRGWLAPPAPVEVVASTVVAPVVAAGPPEPPPLPYRFMGRLNNEGVDVVYLSKGDQSFVARDGETFDGTYKIVAMNAQYIEFEFLPTGDKQTLTIPPTEK